MPAMFAYDGPDISSFQPVGDWPVVASTGAQFAGIRLGNGPYTDWDWQAGTAVRKRGFVDPHAGENLVSSRAGGMRWRALYYVVTPLEAPADVVGRIAGFYAINGGYLPGELIGIDYEGNPNRGPDGELVAPDEYCSPEQVEAIRVALAAAYGASAVGAYGSRGWLDRLDLPRFGWRWLASYTLDAKAAALERGCEIVQWTSSAQIDGIAAGRVDMNEVLDAAALDAAAKTEVPTVGSPQGSVDVVEAAGPGKVRVAGWMFDADVPDQPIEAHVYLDGVLVGSTLANRERSDVNAALGIAGDHGFDAVFEKPVQVDVYAINVGDGGNAHIGGKRAGGVFVAAGGDTGPAGPAGPAGDTGPAGAGGAFDPAAVRALVQAEIVATPFETKALGPRGDQ